MSRVKILILHPSNPDIEGIAKTMCGALVSADVQASYRSDYWEVQPFVYDWVYILENQNSDEQCYKQTKWWANRMMAPDRWKPHLVKTNVERLYTETLKSYKSSFENSYKMRWQYEKEEAERLLSKIDTQPRQW